MKVSCSNRQSDLRVDSTRVEGVVKSVLDMKGVVCDAVFVHLVDIEVSCALHRQYFRRPGPTDSMSFPISSPSDPKDGWFILGEIVVCPAVAKKYASVHHLDPHEELTLYLVHGLLHLIGFDDRTGSQRRQMRVEEGRCLKYLSGHCMGLRL